MLILTRRPGQSILIGRIRMTVERLRNDLVLLSLRAPNNREAPELRTLRAGESFGAGTNATVTVARIRGDQVRIGIDAPAEVRILREELLDAASA